MIYRINFSMIVSLSLSMMRLYGMMSLSEELLPQQLTEVPSGDKSVAFQMERHDGVLGWQLQVNTCQGNLTADFISADVMRSNASLRAPAFYAYAQSAASKEIVDLWPVNGRCTMPIPELFSKVVLNHLRMQAGVADAIDGEQLRLFVLDLKDRAGRYRSLEQIASAEIAIRDLLVCGERAHVESDLKKAQSMFRNTQLRFLQPLRTSSLRFFLREGLLKATLVTQVFTSRQIELFDSPGEQNAPGRAAFCMLCEMLMNGFKMGYAVRISSESKTYTLHPDEFFEFASLSEKNAASEMSQESLALCIKQLHAIKLHTLYSPLYREIYGADREYYRALACFFKTEHRLHKPLIQRRRGTDESETMITQIALQDSISSTCFSGE